jgi:hypothetical protein
LSIFSAAKHLKLVHSRLIGLDHISRREVGDAQPTSEGC